MRRLLCTLCCAGMAAAAWADGTPEIPPFSSGQPGGPPPAGWRNVPLASFKNNTEYSLASDGGVVVLKAVAHNAASLLATRVEFDPHQFPILSWRWKVVQGIPTANTAEQAKEDAPVRILVAFDGDESKLSTKDRLAAKAAQSISGITLPYATLMYVWGSKVPLDSITPSSRSARIRMLALAVDEQGVGEWHSYRRNLVEDFKRVFGEDPVRVHSIEVLTDTDNTGADAQALYGDISLSAAKP
ncbi:MAG TPA: DUF3047 domain-containing protein [Casimicrobiaceae bacterium]|nr:DUF3047 domain-containing protein [Casimicrobiaceae bacterium]